MKPQPNRDRYLAVLRGMTPEQRLQKAWELTEATQELLRSGLRQRFPNATETEIHTLYLKQLEACRNRNY